LKLEAFLSSRLEFVREEVIGKSFENRNLTVIKLCKNGCGTKPSIWIQAGIICPCSINDKNYSSSMVQVQRVEIGYSQLQQPT
jgi:hypothetical protein